MKNRNWTDNELRLLEEWDWVRRYIDTQYPVQVSEIDKLRYLVLEAKLLIINKLVIFYSDKSNIPEEILSFREYLRELEKADAIDYKISFHPINFMNITEYRNYIIHIRDEFFALLN